MSLQYARAIKEQNSIKYNSAFKEHIYILKVKENAKDWKSDSIYVYFNFFDFCDSLKVFSRSSTSLILRKLL